MKITTGHDVGVRFEREGHTYTLASGVVVPSLSEVIRESGRFPPFPETPKMDFLRNRGTLVHQAIAYDLRGTLDPTSVDERIKGYLEAARNVMADLQLHPLEIEVVLVDDGHRFAGTVDLIAKDPKDELVILDWKTGSWYEEYNARAGGYIYLVDRALHAGFKGRVIYPSLKTDGSYKLMLVDPIEAMAQWTITLQDYFRNKGVKV